MGVQHAKELMITPQRLRQGGVTLQTFALWTGSKGNQGDVNGIVAAEMAAIPALLAAGMRQVDDPAQAQEGESSFMLPLRAAKCLNPAWKPWRSGEKKACAWLPCLEQRKRPGAQRQVRLHPRAHVLWPAGGTGNAAPAHGGGYLPPERSGFLRHFRQDPCGAHGFPQLLPVPFAITFGT